MIDEIDDMADMHDEDDMPKSKSAFWIITTFMLAACLITFLLLSRNTAKSSLVTDQQNAASVYQVILEETNTGIRLVRLEDYLSQYPNPKNIATAIVQRNALKTNEDMAWARLSSAYYSLDNDALQKSAALKHYLQNWGQIVRGPQLQNLAGNGYDKAYPSRKPTGKQSRFTDATSQDNALVGGPVQRPTARTYTSATLMPIQATPRKTMEATVRRAHEPKYPSKALRKNISALVVLRFNIDERGYVSQVQTVSVSATRYEKKFAKAARRAARRSRFYPKTIGGKPVPTSGYERTYRFSPR